MIATTLVLLGLGFVFLLGASIGLLRLPDCYTRAHAAGLCDAVGAQLCFLGLAIYNFHEGVTPETLSTSGKVLLVAMFVLVSSPTATHAIFRGAYQNGVVPWRKPDEAKP